MATGTWQEKSLGVGQLRGWGEGAQGKNAGDHAAHLMIGRDQSLGVQLAERDMESPLIRPQLSQAVQGEVDALTDADSRGAREQEGIGVQIIGAEEFLLEKLIVVWRKRPGQIVGQWGEVVAANQVRLDRVSLGGEVVQEAAKAEQVIDAGLIAQRMILFAHRAEPAEQMGIATKLRQPAELRKGGVQIAQETAGHGSVVEDGTAPQSERESLDVRFEDLIESELGRFGLAHEIWGMDAPVRFSMARAYSRHTSWGASWT